MDRLFKAGRKWDLLGILGTTGDRVQDTQKAVVEFIKEIGVYHKI